MKKKWWLVIALMMVLVTMVGCGKEAQTPAQEESAQSAQEEKKDTEKKDKTLIAVFTLSNNMASDKDIKLTTSATLNKDGYGLKGDTEEMADLAEEITAGDRYDILLKEQYPANEEKVYEIAQKEQLNKDRPALTEKVKNMDAYSNIILIYPNWFGDMPMAVYTFLESNDMSKKNIIPVVCYDAEDAGTQSSWEGISKVTPGAYVTKGYSVRSGGTNTKGTRTDFKNWLGSLNINF